MKCDFCDKKATVFLTQLKDGEMKKVCLCEPCAEERGVTDPTGFSLADMLLGNFQKDVGDPGGEKTVKKVDVGDAKQVCPQCGFGLKDFEKVQRFGCGKCYEVFREELSPMLRGMHKGEVHSGKVPEGAMEMHLQSQRLEELRGKLETAIEAENYEAAADLRDQIQRISNSEVRG